MNTTRNLFRELGRIFRRTPAQSPAPASAPSLYQINNLDEALETAVVEGLIDPSSIQLPECPIVQLYFEYENVAVVQPLGTAAPLINIHSRHLTKYTPPDFDYLTFPVQELFHLRFVFLGDDDISQYDTYLIGNVNRSANYSLSKGIHLHLYKTYDGCPDTCDEFLEEYECLDLAALEQQVREKRILIYCKTPQGESS